VSRPPQLGRESGWYPGSCCEYANERLNDLAPLGGVSSDLKGAGDEENGRALRRARRAQEDVTACARIPGCDGERDPHLRAGNADIRRYEKWGCDSEPPALNLRQAEVFACATPIITTSTRAWRSASRM